MKTIFYSLLFSIFIFSCKKQADHSLPTNNPETTIDAGYLVTVMNYMYQHMPDTLYRKIDTTGFVLTKEPPYWYFRIRFINRPMERAFILLTTDSVGNISDGKIIELSRDSTVSAVFNGRIRVRTISGASLTESTVTNGFVDSWKGNGRVTLNSVKPMLAAPELEEDDPVYQDLPEVTIYPDAGGSMSGSDIYLLLSGLGGGYSNSYGSGYGYSVGSGYATYTRAASPTTKPAARPMTNRPQTLTVETSYQKPAIDVKAFLNCFGSVPDAGASYSVNVYVDLPVNDDPSQFFDPYSGATGHVFLGLTKSSGGHSVTQYMGFTAANALSAISSPAAVTGKVVDNAGHKYNASLSTLVSAAEFASAMNQMQSQASAQYDIVNFNCVDFALGVVNSARGNYPLVIDKYPVPDETTPMSTPEALYNTINSMSRGGGPEAENTDVGGVWDAGTSHGACN